MKRPRFTDERSKYHDAETSREPGYLARRMKAYARLQRMKARTNVTPIPQRKAGNGQR